MPCTVSLESEPPFLSVTTTEALAARVPQLASADLRTLCPDGLHTTPALLALLQDCRDAARATSDSLNTLFFAHSGESSQSVGA